MHPDQPFDPRARVGISASAVKTAKRCLRRWALRAIAGLPRDQSKPAEESKAAHVLAENYLKFGTMPDLTRKEGRWLLRGLHLLPKTGSVLVEQAFSFVAFGVLFDGYKDFCYRSIPYTGDHKFIKDTNERALDRSQLLQDDQAMLYALGDCIRCHTTCSTVDWLWYPKYSGPMRRTLIEQVPIEHSARHVHDQIVPTARIMKQIRSVAYPSIDWVNYWVPKNNLACFDYNKPCPYAYYCR